MPTRPCLRVCTSSAKATDSLEQKRNLYGALAAALEPALVQKALALALTDELPPQAAAYLVQRIAMGSEQPELAWKFAQEHLGALLAKLASTRANDYVPGIFGAFSESARATELEEWARKNMPADAGAPTARAADAIRFKAGLKARLLPQIDAWSQARAGR